MIEQNTITLVSACAMCLTAGIWFGFAVSLHNRRNITVKRFFTNEKEADIESNKISEYFLKNADKLKLVSLKYCSPCYHCDPYMIKVKYRCLDPEFKPVF